MFRMSQATFDIRRFHEFETAHKVYQCFQEKILLVGAIPQIDFRSYKS